MTNTDDLDAISAYSTETLRLAREVIAGIEHAREEQPARLAAARSAADEARGWSLIEEPWHTLITALPTYSSGGERTGDSLSLPSITAKELFGARLAFDMLDAGLDDEDDPDRVDNVKTRYFTELQGDTGLLFLVTMAALDTIATLIVPQMVDELETRASNYDIRVMLAEARTKSWNGRVSEIRKLNDESVGEVKPVDGYDIAANAINSDDILGGGLDSDA
ncbi:hypothetical protein [Mycolicibacterium frederiksbergense]|uniref:hypothetical protein n=1 Tax=Mycolicibacterium frederiksbergense TaxID=117567 RepID=UPI00265B9A14|nr:hypothetical protein [Mycolicibacterium frederiksbergense]MDO0977179.1 hypothetical protein [Mycolicibacterium frederiksbergense]